MKVRKVAHSLVPLLRTLVFDVGIWCSLNSSMLRVLISAFTKILPFTMPFLLYSGPSDSVLSKNEICCCDSTHDVLLRSIQPVLVVCLGHLFRTKVAFTVKLT